MQNETDLAFLEDPTEFEVYQVFASLHGINLTQVDSSEGNVSDLTNFLNDIAGLQPCKDSNGAKASEYLFVVTKWIKIVEGYTKVQNILDALITLLFLVFCHKL